MAETCVMQGLPKYYSYYGILKLARTEQGIMLSKVSHRNYLFQMNTAMGGRKKGE